MAINNLYSRLQLWHPRNASSSLEKLDVIKRVILDTKGIFTFLLLFLFVVASFSISSRLPSFVYFVDWAKISSMAMLGKYRNSLKM